ncbi:OmpA family protein [Rhodobacteraceae bacterium D3-12]|nr:OmpA family protein [Rhodobacteraceae bacterium D3-12]
MMNTTRNRADRSLNAPVGRGRFALAPLALCVALLGFCVTLPGAAGAVDLTLPRNAVETARTPSAVTSFNIATGPVLDGTVPTQTLEGQVTRAAWRIHAQGVTTLQLLHPLRDQLVKAGFETLFECDAPACGGFDFRYQITVFPEPDMHVDLFDFRYLTARRTRADGGAEYVTILISRSANSGFIQITQIAPQGSAPPKSTTSGKAANTATTTPVIPGATLPLDQQLLQGGHAVLSDLAFETGSSTLGAGNFPSLGALSAFLLADASRRVALVGHTDAVGALDGNIALSKRRAASVLERLVSEYSVPRAQLEAGGMGYLSPIATNLTAQGRELNRRVEAVLLNTK